MQQNWEAGEEEEEEEEVKKSKDFGVSPYYTFPNNYFAWFTFQVTLTQLVGLNVRKEYVSNAMTRSSQSKPEMNEQATVGFINCA